MPTQSHGKFTIPEPDTTQGGLQRTKEMLPTALSEMSMNPKLSYKQLVTLLPLVTLQTEIHFLLVSFQLPPHSEPVW